MYVYYIYSDLISVLIITYRYPILYIQCGETVDRWQFINNENINHMSIQLLQYHCRWLIKIMVLDINVKNNWNCMCCNNKNTALSIQFWVLTNQHLVTYVHDVTTYNIEFVCVCKFYINILHIMLNFLVVFIDLTIKYML